MDRFATWTGVGAPLRQTDVDTDQIIPSAWLSRISRDGYGDGLFSGWRSDPSFVLNQDAYRRATVLVAGSDFGIGSSREQAVWALLDYGFRAVVCSRFGDIFSTNCGKSGLLAAQVEEAGIELLWSYLEANPGAELSVDLEGRTVVGGSPGAGGPKLPFAIDDYTRWRLLNGLDDIAITLADEAAITAFEERRPALKPHVEKEWT